MNATTGLTITNPLVLYRALVATNRINPDPAQLRLGEIAHICHLVSEESHRSVLKLIFRSVASSKAL
jgi:hypothetical protein